MRPLVMLLVALVTADPELPHLTTDDSNYVNAIQGFATQLQCVLNTCSEQVNWYKNDKQIFAGTKMVDEEDVKSFKLQHNVDIDYEKGCNGECDDSSPCANGLACVDNQCCACQREEFTLVLRNLTFEDSARYRCQLGNQSEQLEFQVEVLESGLKGGFHQNISYDHDQCCQQKGISPMCRGMCKPSDMEVHHFDPTSCKTDDYKHFLSCATENGTRSHIHCCKAQLVPSFCYDFCTADFKMLRRSHRLCLYYLPEIFSCLDRAYLPFPESPRQVTVNPMEHDKLRVCWKEPEVHEANKAYPVRNYSVYFKELPSILPLFGGDAGFPLLSGDYAEDVEEMPDDEVDYVQKEDSPKDDGKRKKRSFSYEKKSHGTDQEVLRREKRTAMTIVTRDEVTNTTTVRDLAYQEVNTTDTCVTLSDLRSASHYTVYVTASNDYGASLPSTRAFAATNVHVVSNNASLPDSYECCQRANVSAFCAPKMCNTAEDPSAFSTITLATTCRNEWHKVSPCIADGRNHTECCRRRGVEGECLRICEGDTQPLGVHAVLCLNLDLHAIYQCLRQGYESHPSAPVNVTVTDVTRSSVTVTWEEPDANAHLVENYTMFIKKADHGAQVRQISNVKSPHTEEGLEPDSEYVVSVQSHSDKGLSLPSTALLFATLSFTPKFLCPIGEPIFLTDGTPMVCDALNTCPAGFRCSGPDADESFCCPHEGEHSDEDFQTCCDEQKMPEECRSQCFYNSTLSEPCRDNLNFWIQCASEGRDHLRCCEQEGVPKQCLDACRHPFTVPDACYPHVSLLHTCFSGSHEHLPAAVHNVEVTSITKDSATITWEDLEANLLGYRIQLFDDDGTFVKSENTSVDILRLTNLTAQTTYKARVLAINQLGEGPPSWNVTFTTKPAQVYEGDRPKAPDGLKIVTNSGTKVNITWNPVTQRRNDDQVKMVVEYTLFYLDTDQTTVWTSAKTNRTWHQLTDLNEGSLYYVYVTAKEDEKTSRSSSVITLLASPDAMGLPEPKIDLSPDRKDGIYSSGETLKINCSLPNTVDTLKHLNIDLSVGKQVVQNDHGTLWVSLETEVDEKLDTTSCAVSDTDGRQHVAMRHLILHKGPSIRVTKEKIRVLDDQSADIECVFRGSSDGLQILFEKDGAKLRRGTMSVRNTEAGVVAKLHLKNVETVDAGIYKCIGKTATDTVEDRAELIVSTETLPVNPKLVLQCCLDQGIDDDCLQACSIGRPPAHLNCTKHAASLLKCATDVRDHSDCCVAAGVSTRCLPLCSGDSFSPDVDCSPFAVDIMECFVKGHEQAPVKVYDVKVKTDGKGTARVDWAYPPTTNYKYFAVYYRKKDASDEDDWKMEKSLQQNIELELDPNSEYEVGVLAANAYGHSPLIYSTVPIGKSTAVKPSESSGGSSTFWILCLLTLSTGIIFGLVFLVRSKELRVPFLGIGRRNDFNQPTVAFENPAYAGNEVEIRGLGDGNGATSTTRGAPTSWESADLHVGGDGEEATTPRNGGAARYSKLDM